jgi:transposase-like protein
MSFKETDMSLSVRANPAQAKGRIIMAYHKTGANLEEAAKLLDTTDRTLRRWVLRLKLTDELRRLKAAALKEGWHHDHSRHGGRPAAPSRGRKKAS